MTHRTSETDEQIREQIEAGAIDEATDLALRAYGDAAYNYIRRLAGDPIVADDAFQEFSVDLWEGLETFEWRSSLETWLFTVARHATYRRMRRDRRDRERPFRTDEQRELVAKWTRTVTRNFEKTEAKHWLWETIEEFEPEKRELLVLRVGHQMAWKEVARVMSDEDLEGDELRRVSNRLRKNYQRLKQSLRARRDEFDG